MQCELHQHPSSQGLPSTVKGARAILHDHELHTFCRILLHRMREAKSEFLEPIFCRCIIQPLKLGPRKDDPQALKMHTRQCYNVINFFPCCIARNPRILCCRAYSGSPAMESGIFFLFLWRRDGVKLDVSDHKWQTLEHE